MIVDNDIVENSSFLTEASVSPGEVMFLQNELGGVFFFFFGQFIKINVYLVR